MGEVTTDWRNANILPLFKKGCKVNPGNYRPVSRTSMVGKLLERFLNDTIYVHLDTGVVRDSWHGFVSGRSCLMNFIAYFFKHHKG